MRGRYWPDTNRSDKCAMKKEPSTVSRVLRSVRSTPYTTPTAEVRAKKGRKMFSRSTKKGGGGGGVRDFFLGGGSGSQQKHTHAQCVFFRDRVNEKR